ncbi:MAG: hypothetical protein OXF50_11535 [Caldilineaceae bacterium]|nr:hypothetical protein [Caldilineaceae bacterium]
MTQQITDLPALWQEAEGHLRAFEQLARRTVEEAWLAGDSLLRIKQQLPHGAWTPALEERRISTQLARRLIRLRRKYPQIVQIERFDSVSAALTDSKKAKPEPTEQPKLMETPESAEHTGLAEFVEPAEENEPDKPAESIVFARSLEEPRSAENTEALDPVEPAVASTTTEGTGLVGSEEPVEEPYPNAGTGLRRIEQISSGPRGIPKNLPPMRRRQLRTPGRLQGATRSPARPFFGVWVGPARAPGGPQRVVWSIPLPSIRWKGFLNLSSHTGNKA